MYYITHVHIAMHSKAAIREIFLRMDRTAEYRLASISQLLALSREDAICGIRTGEISARSERDTHLLAWSEVASLAVEKWGLHTITLALGTDREKALPPLLLPRTRVFSLPTYQAQMISALARREKVTPSAVLSNHLLDLAASVADWMEGELPGFIAAMRWPDA